VSGVEPPINQDPPNPQLCLQVIQQTMQAQDYVNFLRQNPLAQERMEKRVKAYQFAIQQQQNAQIGKIGVPPAPVSALSGGVGPAPPPGP
jgi:hypothetical protein